MNTQFQRPVTTASATNFPRSRRLTSGAAYLPGAALGLLLLVDPSLHGATLYVSISGSDSTGRRGDPSYPFRTVAKAHQVAWSGDTISIGAGDYLEYGFSGKQVRLMARSQPVRLAAPGSPGGIGGGTATNNAAPVIQMEDRIEKDWLGSPLCFHLPASVQDDGKPNPPGRVATLWEQLDPNPRVDFSDSTVINTRACFTAPGTYQLRLTAWDGITMDAGAKASKTMTVQIVDRSLEYLKLVSTPACFSGEGSVGIMTPGFEVWNTHPSLTIQFEAEVRKTYSSKPDQYRITLGPKRSWGIRCGGYVAILRAAFVSSSSSLLGLDDSRSLSLGSPAPAGAPRPTPLLSLIRSAHEPSKEAGLGLYLVGTPSVLYRIEVSTNLAFWTTLIHAEGSETPVKVQDISSADLDARFYRVVEDSGR